MTNPDYRSRVEAENFAFAPFGFSISELPTEVWQRAMTSRDSVKFIVRDILMPNFRRQFDELDAMPEFDLYVAHPLAIAVSLVAEKRKRPWISVSLGPITMLSSEDPSVIDGLPMGIGRNSPLPRPVFKIAYAIAGFMIGRWTKPVARLRRELSLLARENPLLRGQYSPHGNWVLYSKVLQAPQPDWPEYTFQLGFPLYREPGAELSASVKDFLNHHPRPVVFTLGSAAVNASADFFTETVSRLRAEGRSALFAKSEPYHLLFPLASVVVHSCGIGTIAESLRAGIPQILVPFANDQPDNAYRTEKLGVGKRLSFRDFNPDRFLEQLSEVETKSVYARVAQVEKELAAEDFSRAFDTAFDRAFQI